MSKTRQFRRLAIQLAHRIVKMAGYGVYSYLVYENGEYLRGPYDATAAGRLAAAREFLYAPSSKEVTLYANDVLVAQNAK